MLDESASRPSPRSELELTARDDSAGRAREFARTFLRDHGYTHADSFDALVVISELTANAIRHGSRGFDDLRLELELIRQTLRVSVSDAGRGGALAALTPDDSRESGRGLQLVDQLTSRWTERIKGGRREIIAEIPLR